MYVAVFGAGYEQDQVDAETPSQPVGTASPISNMFLAWVENPWRTSMLKPYLIVAALDKLPPDESFVQGLGSTAEPHNALNIDVVQPSIMYVPRIYRKDEWGSDNTIRGLEWFVEDQVGTGQPGLIGGGFSLALVTPAQIASWGAAPTQYLSEAKSGGWFKFSGEHAHFPTINLDLRGIEEGWGQRPITTPGAIVYSNGNLLQLGREAGGLIGIRLFHASQARMQVPDFQEYVRKGRTEGVLVSLHRLHTQDICNLLSNERLESALDGKVPDHRQVMGPFCHMGRQNLLELVLQWRKQRQDEATIAVETDEQFSQRAHAELAVVRNQLYQKWLDRNVGELGWAHAVRAALTQKMFVVSQSIGAGIMDGIKLQRGLAWLDMAVEVLEANGATFMELQLWTSQLDVSANLHVELELGEEFGPWPLDRFVAEPSSNPPYLLEDWLSERASEDLHAGGCSATLDIHSNRPEKKVWRMSTKRANSDRSSRPDYSFLEMLSLMDQLYECGAQDRSCAIRRRGSTSWHIVRGVDWLEKWVDDLEANNLFDLLRERAGGPHNWTPTIRASMLIVLGMVTEVWLPPSESECLYQFVDACREINGYATGGSWSDKRQRAAKKGAVVFPGISELNMTGCFPAYWAELGWVLYLGNGVGLSADYTTGERQRNAGCRVHSTVGYAITVMSDQTHKAIGWRRMDCVWVGSEALNMALPELVASSHDSVNLARAHAEIQVRTIKELKEGLEKVLGVEFRSHIVEGNVFPALEVHGPKRKLQRVISWLPNINVSTPFGGGGVQLPSSMSQNMATSLGHVHWVWTQDQLRALSENVVERLHAQFCTPRSGSSMALARAVADAVVVWAVSQDALPCRADAHGCWLPSRSLPNTEGFVWTQPLELGPLAGLQLVHDGLRLLLDDTRALEWPFCAPRERSDGHHGIMLNVTGNVKVVPVGSGVTPDGAYRRPRRAVVVG